MQGDIERSVSLENVQKGQVTILIGLLDHAIKIANRLVIVQYQTEADRFTHGGFLGEVEVENVWAVPNPQFNGGEVASGYDMLITIGRIVTT